MEEGKAGCFSEVEPQQGKVAPDVHKRMQERHRAWLNRGKMGVKPSSWRPRKVHRAAAKKWILAIDLQLKSVNGGVGLIFYSPDEAACFSWNQRPHLACAMDLGLMAIAGTTT